MARTLTTANSVLAIQVVGLFDTPQNIQGYATDDMFSIGSVKPAEVVMGVDGKQSAGFTPQSKELTIMLQADSDSNDFFDDWITATEQAREIFICNATIILPGVQKKYALTKGVMSEQNVMPDAKKTAQARKFVITFESITPSPV